MNGEGIFAVVDDTLVCHARELDLTHADAFHDRLEQLLASDVSEIRVDLSACAFLSTVFLGILLATAARCRSNGRRLRLFVSGRLQRYLDTGSLGDALPYECVEAGETSTAVSGQART